MGVLTLRSDALLESEDHAGFALDDVVATGARVLECRLGPGTIKGGNLSGTVWRESRLESVRVIGTGLARSRWIGVEVSGCALSGCELSGAQLRQVRFVDCLLDSVNLRSARLREVVLEGCQVRDLDLGSAELEEVRWPGSRIERLDLSFATLAGVDLRGASVDIARGVDRLRGAVIDHGQLVDLAPVLAAHLGVTVRDRDDGP